MKTGIFIFFLIILSTSLQAQEKMKITLSENHQKKLDAIKSPREKLDKYHKYYTIDSLKYIRSLDKLLRRKSDSIYACMQEAKEKKQAWLEQAKDNKVLNKAKDLRSSDLLQPVSPDLENTKVPNLWDSQTPGDILNEGDKLGNLSQQAENINLPDNPAENINLESIGGEKIKSVREDLTPYQQYYNEYKNYLNHPDSLQQMVRKVAEKEMENLPEKITSHKKTREAINQLKKQQAQAEALKDMPKQYQESLEKYSDPAALKEEVKTKASEKAATFLIQQQDKLKEVQKKMSKLKRRYSKLGNSNDLSTAVKRNSLKGKPIKERLYMAGNFQFIHLDPVSIDFSPAIGYRFNKLFIAGLGATYRQTFGEFDLIHLNLPEKQLGFNAFVQHDVMKGFFAYSSYEKSNRSVKDSFSDQNSSLWVPGWLVGIGKTMQIHPRIYTQLLLLYNILHEPGQSPYKSPWMVKTGIRIN